LEKNVMGVFRRRSKPLDESFRVPASAAVPLLAGDAWLEGSAQTLAQIPDFPASQAPYVRSVASGLFVVYASDHVNPSWNHVRTGQVQSQQDADGLHERAIANLRQRGNISVVGYEGRYRLTVPDELDLSASLVLDPARWTPTFPISGDLIIACPTRIEMLVCSAANDADTTSLRETAAMLFEAAEGKPVSPSLYRLSGTVLSLA
jgi:hypothetical protein